MKPESWAENNALVKAVLSIPLWKKQQLSAHPQTPNPMHLGIYTHMHTLYRHLHTPSGTLRLNLTSVHWYPPTIPFCPFYPHVMETVVCAVLFASVWLSNVSLHVCVHCVFLRQCVYVCVCVSLTQQILCSILVIVCVVWEMIDLGTHTPLQTWKKTEKKKRGRRWWRSKKKSHEDIKTECTKTVNNKGKSQKRGRQTWEQKRRRKKKF